MLSVRMRLSSVLLFAVLVVSSVVEGRSESEPESLNQVVEEPPFTACIDDGDCNKGEGFACFQYICYPWRDDTVIERKHRKETCTNNRGCGEGETCFRHHDRRNVHKGLCMKDTVNCNENGHADCKEDGPERKCCAGQFCCEDHYYTQLTVNVQCNGHFFCQDLHLGKFCCPNQFQNSSTCCNVDPNPKPEPVQPETNSKQTGVNGASQFLAPVFLLWACAVAVLRQ